VKVKLNIPGKGHSRQKRRANPKCVAEDATSRPKRKPPIIESEKPGSLDLDNAKIYQIIDFP
jgi:hypothetical protein